MSTKKLGDVGLGEAIRYFTGLKQTVLIPLTDSQDYDLVVDRGEKLVKVQVKYTSYKRNGTYQTNIVVRGGTKGKITKMPKDIFFDDLFVLFILGKRFVGYKV
jgi:hypothetical protein